MPEDPWEAARVSARDDVRAALARREAQSTCAHCGWAGVTDAPRCPQCGRLWSARRRKGLSARGRRNAITAGLLALVAGGAAAAVLIPRIDESKRSSAERERREVAERRASQLAVLKVQQRPHRATASPAGAGDLAGRAAMVGALEAGILRDARERVRAGAMDGPVIRVTCEAYPVNVGRPRVPVTGAVGRYQCYAISQDVRRGNGEKAGFIGPTFWARATFATGALVWCRTYPRPGERGLQVLSPEIPLSAECNVRS